MTDYYVVWHDVEDYEPRRTFELIKVPGEKLSQENHAVPSMAGLKTMYIRWHRQQAGEDQLYLVTYTHRQLKEPEIKELIDQAFQFIYRHKSGIARTYELQRASALQTELAVTISQFLARYPDTLKSEVLAALQMAQLA